MGWGQQGVPRDKQSISFVSARPGVRRRRANFSSVEFNLRGCFLEIDCAERKSIEPGWAPWHCLCVCLGMIRSGKEVW